MRHGTPIVMVLLLTATSSGGCGAKGATGNSDAASVQGSTGGNAGATPNVGGFTADTGGAASASSDAGLVDTGVAGAGCYRDPYLPDNYQPPCEQPTAVPNCAGGWCMIEPGCFIMGEPWCQWYRARFSDDPVQVTLTHRYRIQQFEMTQRQWTAEGLPNPSGLMADGTGDCLESECPVGNVTWLEALAFANLLSQNEGLSPCYVLESCQGELGSGLVCDAIHSTYSSVYDCPGYRLPTGAEWEYAARAGTKTTVYSGDILDTGHVPFTCYDEPVLLPIAWYCANAGPYTHPVGQKLPNDWGLYDVIGNAEEWSGSESAMYGPGPFVDWGAELSLTGFLQPGSSFRQTRGGGIHYWPNILQVGSQHGVSGFRGGPTGGFRLVHTLFK